MDKEQSAETNITTHVDFLYSALHMPVHNAIGNFALFMLLLQMKSCNPNLRNYGNKNHLNVAVIGAGCCALPAFLLTQWHSNNNTSSSNINEHNGNTTSEVAHGYLHIDAVDPEEEVLQVAEQYFGIQFDNDDDVTAVGIDGNSNSNATNASADVDADADTDVSREYSASNNSTLIKHVTDGCTFLTASSLKSKKFDILIVDAFANADSNSEESSSPNSYAPPTSLLSLEQCKLMHSALLSSIDCDGAGANVSGILLMNVYGPDVWVEFVKSQIANSSLFCLPFCIPIINHIGGTGGNATPLTSTASTTSSSTFNLGDRNVVLVLAPIQEKYTIEILRDIMLKFRV